MTQPNLTHLAVFAAVARNLSFQKAAVETGLSSSAVSHAIRGLEERLGVSLLNRTTRSVALTEAGRHFLQRLEPALRDVDEAVETMNDFRASPAGTLRINTSRVGAQVAIAPLMARFLETYPGISFEVVENNSLIDVVSAGFDAGIRFVEAVPEDMVAVPIGPSSRYVVVVRSDRLETVATPAHPNDLLSLDCVRYRFPSGRPYLWEFEKDGEDLSVDVPGRLTVVDHELALRAALDGVGFAYLFESAVREHVAAGDLTIVLDDWCPPMPSMMLYYPRQRRVSGALRAFIDFTRP
ncbi:MAG: LysR family transcriptional regulator [Brevundimonas sp.]|uniref:LysR family transcriptional regulator n=1 Tax=Brevundimonas sp. TaxID=1871086 RepID=UPI0025844E41|nr:LysR family transcriptional regulator [Brevundimonas sp.]MCV0413788.1 LysR family transcriptional regulator [Brevundimonas sp.]